MTLGIVIIKTMGNYEEAKKTFSTGIKFPRKITAFLSVEI